MLMKCPLQTYHPLTFDIVQKKHIALRKEGSTSYSSLQGGLYLALYRIEERSTNVKLSGRDDRTNRSTFIASESSLWGKRIDTIREEQCSTSPDEAPEDTTKYDGCGSSRAAVWIEV
jgi:hypothetical protein